MDVTFLTEFTVPLIVGICLCVGYILKNTVTTDKVNKYIPLIMGILGITLNTWLQMRFTPEVLLAGLFSGLASTGCHQMFRQLIHPEDD